MNLLIYGPQGSGKPQVAQVIGAALGLPVFDFDEIEGLAKDGWQDSVITTCRPPHEFDMFNRLHIDVARKLALLLRNDAGADPDFQGPDDPWALPILEWAKAKQPGETFSVAEVLGECLCISTATQDRHMCLRVSRILSAAGFRHCRVLVNGLRIGMYSRANKGDAA